MADEARFFEIDLGDNGGLRRFYSPEEATEFVRAHQVFYSWLGESSVLSLGYYNSVRSSTLNELSHIQSLILGTASGQYTLEQLAQAFRGAFIRPMTPVVGTPEAKFLEALRESEGDAVAAGALALFRDQLQDMNIQNAPALRGIVAASNFRAGLHPKVTASSKRALVDLLNQFQQALNDTKEAFAEERRQDAEARARNRREGRTFALGLAKYLRRFRKAKASEIQEQIQLIEQIRKTYEEMLKLKAPVDYWTKKSAAHRAKSQKYRNALLIFVFISLITIFGIFINTAQAVRPIADASKLPPEFYVYASMAIFGTTVVFWIARIMVRLFMSEHHLAIDAEERATMALTYLALTEKGAAQEEDRKIVLAPLFRPSSDGIVKDDAAPDISPAAWISKGLSR